MIKGENMKKKTIQIIKETETEKGEENGDRKEIGRRKENDSKRKIMPRPDIQRKQSGRK